MWFIGVEVEQETSAPPPKKNTASAPAVIIYLKILSSQFTAHKCMLRLAWEPQTYFRSSLVFLRKITSDVFSRLDFQKSPSSDFIWRAVCVLRFMFIKKKKKKRCHSPYENCFTANC